MPPGWMSSRSATAGLESMGLRHVVRTASAVFCGVVMLVAASCTTDPPRGSGSMVSTTGTSALPRVLVIGDSITAQGKDVIVDRLGPRYDLSVDGKSGYRADQQVATAHQLATRGFDQVVIELGTNDVFQGVDPEVTGESLHQIVEAFGSARCIHIVDVNESMPSEDHDLPARAERLNAVIRRIADGDPRIGVVGWAGIVRGYDGSRHGEPIAADGVHPGAAGQDLLVGAYLDALEACGSAGL